MGYGYYTPAADDDSATTVALTVAGFVGALALLALGLYAMQPPPHPTTLRSDPSAPDGRRLLALHVAGISGAEREWIEADLAAVRRRLEHDCIRGLARRRGPAEWQVIDGPALSVALAVEGMTAAPSSASSSAATETVFISPATPPRIAPPPPTAATDPAAAAAPVVPDRPGFRTHPASSVSLAAVSAVRRFPSFDAAAAATPPARFIVAGAGPSDPAFYAVTTTTASGGTVVVADPTAGTTVYERV